METPEGLELGAHPPGYRSGFVSIIGRPNVGKSTLLNQILRRKVSIISSRPQTTRSAVRGVLTTQAAQLVFVDTPGLHKPQTALGRNLNKIVRDAMADVDVVVFVVDAAGGVGAGDRYLAAELAAAGAPVIVALNKIDLTEEARFLPQAAQAQKLGEWPVYSVSARSGGGVADLVGAIVEALPEGPLLYPPDVHTDDPERHRIAELVREQLLEAMREEVPHSIAVVVEEMSFDEERGVTDIDAVVYVERDSQKGIVIGKGGAVLKEVGTRARPEIEQIVGSRVYLNLYVKVARDWQRRASMVERFSDPRGGTQT